MRQKKSILRRTQGSRTKTRKSAQIQGVKEKVRCFSERTEKVRRIRHMTTKSIVRSRLTE